MCPFIYLSCLIALAKISSTILNNSDESRHHFLVPDFRGKAFNLSLLSIIKLWVIYYVVFNMLRYVPPIFNWLWMLNFVKCFFCIY